MGRAAGAGVNELALFAGAGGGILAGKLLGWRTVCAVEWEPYAASVLAARQNDGFLPAFPIWDDVRTFDGHPWRGLVDVVSGGFPCQDISNSGHKVGILGERSGLWREMARIVGEVRPRYVFVENVAALLSRGMGAVLADLAELGFDAQWRVLGTGDIGGVQTRERLWIVANAQGIGRESVFEKLRLLQATSAHRPRLARDRCLEYASDSNGVLRPTKPGLVRVADGMADRMDRIRATGNGQDPLCAATAWRLLTGDIAE